MNDDVVTTRAFKTAWFTKTARKALIKDDELCDAIREVMKGQADDLGGGVFKKRLNKNRHRSIVLAKGGEYWVYTYLFAKSDRANIDDKELAGFRKLAQTYEGLNVRQIDQLLRDGDLAEICDGD
ncbi:type II toxin-antitoxin system RelE/ParE family toxin [Sphingomonas faeni]|uniref:type II toxin-antitoxin system RelE/ParE family toxin n=1 Tax=Sphingomonas faeni TaxID=185950 RepID=UPI002413202B|nr:type II toxin-antitoxin system RelE/ParE family toxin [Sphingomonas faeni]